MNDPQQELFAALKVRLEAKGYDVYDGFLPPDDTPYPFIYLDDFQQVDSANKSAVFGSVFPTIHVWHNNPRARGTVSRILLDIKMTCRELSHTDNFAWHVRAMSQRIISDTTTAAPLMHAVLTPEFAFS